jgi:IS1 family transposase
MNTLPIDKKVQIVHLLVEGSSLRAAARIANVTVKTVIRLLVDVGRACENFHNEKVMFVNANKIQCDEIWSFCYSKQKNVPERMEGVAGDIWTFTCLESESKLMISWLVGNRDAESTQMFMNDVAYRIKGKPGQLSTDGMKEYQSAVLSAFGSHINYAQVVKHYSNPAEASTPERKYSPSKFIGAKKKFVFGRPDRKFISTSHVERSNLTLRMGSRRFTRLTNGFSKKIENHALAVALHMTYYNFVRPHQSLRITPAMAAGLTKRFMTIEDIVNLVPEPVAKKRGPYKKTSKKIDAEKF